MIPLGSWEPDAFVVNDGKVSAVQNLYPVPNGWGPVPGISEISTALGAKCLGAVSVRTGANSYQIFAGTATKLYRFSSGSLGWTDVSGGLTFGVPEGDFWSFALFGNYLLATNFVDGLHEIDLLAGSAFAATAGRPPKARFVDVAGDFVVLGCLQNAQNALHWSGLNDRTQWTTGTNFSDTQTFPDGGVIRGMACQEAGLVFQEDTVRRMTLVGGSQIFTFSVLARNRRLRAPYSVIPLGTSVLALMDHGVCIYSQSGETQIGVGKVDNWLKEYADGAWWPRIVGCVDPTNTRVYWALRSVDGSGIDNFDSILVYDTTLQRFSLIAQKVDYIFPCATAGLALEDLNNFGTLDTLETSLDSAAWGGGVPNFGQIGANGILGFRAAASVKGSITTAERALTPGRRSMVTGLYPFSDCGSMTASVSGKATAAAADVFSTDAGMEVNSKVPLRSDGRFHSFRLTFPAASVWTYANGFDLDYVTTGAR